MGSKRDIGETKIKLEFGQKSTTLKDPARIGLKNGINSTV